MVDERILSGTYYSFRTPTNQKVYDSTYKSPSEPHKSNILRCNETVKLAISLIAIIYCSYNSTWLKRKRDRHLNFMFNWRCVLISFCWILFCGVCDRFCERIVYCFHPSCRFIVKNGMCYGIVLVVCCRISSYLDEIMLEYIPYFPISFTYISLLLSVLRYFIIKTTAHDKAYNDYSNKSSSFYYMLGLLTELLVLLNFVMVHCRPGSRINSKFVIICVVRALFCSMDILSYTPNGRIITISNFSIYNNGDKNVELNRFLECLLNNMVCRPFAIILQLYCFSKSNDFNKRINTMTSNLDILFCVMAIISSILTRRLSRCTTTRMTNETNGKYPLIFALPYEISIAWMIHIKKLPNYLPIIYILCTHI